MDLVKRLKDAGFAVVLALDGPAFGVEAPTVVLALWTYGPELAPEGPGAWIHPYYPASQKAYQAASAIAKEMAAEGVCLRDDILLKPIFARLPGFTQGRSTLSFTGEYGSRFHVQTLTAPAMPGAIMPDDAPHALHCGECRRCEMACPTGALEGGVFHRERCLRNWMLGGKPVPESLREKMGSRLLGCDVCQQVCPHNPPVRETCQTPIPLERLLASPKEAAAELRSLIGANLALPNRVLAQACLVAGCSGDASLLPLLEPLTAHPSPVVREHAAWAVAQLQHTNE